MSSLRMTPPILSREDEAAPPARHHAVRMADLLTRLRAIPPFRLDALIGLAV